MDYEELYRSACENLKRNRYKLGPPQTIDDVRYLEVDGKLTRDDEVFELAWGLDVLERIRSERAEKYVDGTGRCDPKSSD